MVIAVVEKNYETLQLPKGLFRLLIFGVRYEN